MGKPAAKGGSVLNHGGALEPAEGIATVRINGIPVWVSRRTHSCPTHGAEFAQTGSETVHAGGHRIQRVGDFLVGKGAPNRIDAGSSNVAVGSPTPGAVGAAVAPDGAFCSDFCALKKDWPNLSPAEREARYTQLVAGLFNQFGAPAPVITTTAKKGSDASWDRQAWSLNLPKGAWESNAPPSDEVTAHEARHAEQAFAALRVMSEAEREGGRVPEHVRDAAAERPVERSSAEGRWARVMQAEQYTPEGQKALNEIAKEMYRAAAAGDGAAYERAADAYEKRPVGQDALEIQQACKCRC